MATNSQIRDALVHARELVVRCKVLANTQMLWIRKCDESLREIDAALAELDAQPSAAPKKGR